MQNLEDIGVDTKSCNTILRGYLDGRECAKVELIVSEKKFNIESDLMENLERVLKANKEALKNPVTKKLSKEQREGLVGLLLGGLQIDSDEERKNHILVFKFNEDSDVHKVLKRHISNPAKSGYTRSYPANTRHVRSRPGYTRSCPAKTRSYSAKTRLDPDIPGHIRPRPGHIRPIPGMSGQDPVRPGYTRSCPANTRSYSAKTRIYPVMSGNDPDISGQDPAIPGHIRPGPSRPGHIRPRPG
ncbi:endonuclease [Artemisia annua]|uniref:Endonuclease n=1 Tax=Artemisia annua TaxID=35608 RepID=A0A2U1KCT6_ARTAN|nr:endonuclease [Artemisia annua]